MDMNGNSMNKLAQQCVHTDLQTICGLKAFFYDA